MTNRGTDTNRKSAKRNTEAPKINWRLDSAQTRWGNYSAQRLIPLTGFMRGIGAPGTEEGQRKWRCNQGKMRLGGSKGARDGALPQFVDLELLLGVR